jgi:hypothetical protein
MGGFQVVRAVSDVMSGEAPRDQDLDGSSDQLIATVAEDALRLPIQAGDASRAVDQEIGVGGVFEDPVEDLRTQFEPAALIGERFLGFGALAFYPNGRRLEIE